MDEGDAKGKRQLQSEYELLFCLRDLMKIYIDQQINIYGRSSESLGTALMDIEARLLELEENV